MNQLSRENEIIKVILGALISVGLSKICYDLNSLFLTDACVVSVSPLDDILKDIINGKERDFFWGKQLSKVGSFQWSLFNIFWSVVCGTKVLSALWGGFSNNFPNFLFFSIVSKRSGKFSNDDQPICFLLVPALFVYFLVGALYLFVVALLSVMSIYFFFFYPFLSACPDCSFLYFYSQIYALGLFFSGKNVIVGVIMLVFFNL